MRGLSGILASLRPMRESISGHWNRGFQTRVLPILMALVVLMVTAVLLRGSGDESAVGWPDRSVYSTAASGYRAWYLAARQSGIPMAIWDAPLSVDKAPPTPSLMLLVSPQTRRDGRTSFAPRDAGVLLRWVEQGHTVVLLDRFGSAAWEAFLNRLNRLRFGEMPVTPLKTALLKPEGRLYIPVASVSKAERNRLSFRVEQPLRTRSMTAFSFGGTAPVHVLLENGRHQPVLIRISYGRGSLLLGGVDDLAENRYLYGEPNDNMQFLTNLLTAEKKPILINEFIHGYTQATDLNGYYRQKTPLFQLATVLGLGFLFVIWLALMRWSPVSGVSSLAETPPGGLAVFVDALASVCERFRAAPLAVEPLLRQIDVVLAKRFGIAPEDESGVRHLLVSRFAPYSSQETFAPERISNAFPTGVMASPEACLQALRKARVVVSGQKRLPSHDVLLLSQQLLLIQEILHDGFSLSASIRVQRIGNPG